MTLSKKNQKLLLDAYDGMKSMVEESKRKEIEKLYKPIDVKTTYQELLAKFTKYELDHIRQNWEFKGISHLKKGELVDTLSSRIQNNLSEWFGVLNREQFDLVGKIIENGGIIENNFADERLIRYYHQRGVMFSGSYDGSSILIMPEELLEISKELLLSEEIRDKIRVNEEILNVSKGLLLYYGVVTYYELYKKLENLISIEVGMYEYLLLLREYMNYNPSVLQRKSYYYLSDVAEPEEIIEEQMRRENLDYYPVTKQMAKSAGKKGHIDWNLVQKNFQKYLMQTHGLTNKEVEILTKSCVNNINSNKSFNEQISFLQKYIKLDSLEQVQELAGYLQQFHNHTRQWTIKGHTPNELATREKKFLKPLSEKVIGSANETIKTAKILPLRKKKKIGRNELCPCGSGKKYKKCCGR